MTKERVALGLVVILIAPVSWFLWPQGRLKATVSCEKADYGIPGITKVYDASIRNVGALPVLVSRCNFIDDAMGHGVMVSYALQRRQPETGTWQQITATSKEGFCKPEPLSIIRANFVRRLLWPGQSLSIGEEATAARDSLKLGDHARFVIFTSDPGDYTHSMPTPEFVIDEKPVEDFGPRIRH